MAENITITEFNEYFRLLGRQLELQGIEEYISVVNEDYLLYRSEDNFSKEEERPQISVPYIYRSNPLGYFLLFHFARFFLDTIGEELIIIRHFREAEIKEVELLFYETRAGNMEISSERENELRDQYNILYNYFREMGREIFTEEFIIENFVNRNI